VSRSIDQTYKIPNHSTIQSPNPNKSQLIKPSPNNLNPSNQTQNSRNKYLNPSQTMNNSKQVSKPNLKFKSQPNSKFKSKPNRNQSLSNNRLKSQNLSQSSKFLSTKKMSSMMKLLRSCKLSSITCALLPNLLLSILNTIRSKMKSSFKLNLFFPFSHSLRPQMPKTTNPSKTSLHKVPNPIPKRLSVTSKPVLLKTKFPKSFLKIDASSLPNSPLKPYPKSSLCCSAVWKTCLKKLSFISNHFTRWLKSNHKNSSSSRYPFS
jgi:hypothetical protein